MSHPEHTHTHQDERVWATERGGRAERERVRPTEREHPSMHEWTLAVSNERKRLRPSFLRRN